MKHLIFMLMVTASTFKCTGARAAEVGHELKHTRGLIIQLVVKDPDAFDMERVREEGFEYICNEEYSKELTALCDRMDVLKAQD